MSFKKKFGVSFIAFLAICGVVVTPLISNGIKASADSKKNSNVSNKTQTVVTANKKADKVVTSDADISIDMLSEQLGRSTGTTVTKIGSTTQMLDYLKNRNNFYKPNLPIRITSVDNSKLKYFPKIADQGSLNSCTAWATVYYQFSYTVNKQLKRDGKLDENTFSPTWVYNMINEGENQGTFYSDAMTVLAEIGAVPMTLVPSQNQELGNNVRDCHATKENWIEASKYRVSEFYNIDLKNREFNTIVTCNTDVDLDTVKKALATGEVLSATTYSSKWVKQTIKANDYVKENSKYIGEKIITMCNTPDYGAHRVTIVGYNDDIWVDINENGCIESGEKGAFKIANSWGENSDNDGFVWMSYDALNIQSSLRDEGNVHLNGVNRDAGLFDIIGFKVDVDSSDSDCLLALDLETDNAEQVHVNIAVKDKTTGEEINNYNPAPFKYSSTIYNLGVSGFRGYGNENNKGEFYIDLGNVVDGLTKDKIDNYDWEITVADTVYDASNLKVNGVKIYIVSENRYIDTALRVPMTMDTQTLKIYYGTENKTEVLNDVYEPEAVG